MIKSQKEVVELLSLNILAVYTYEQIDYLCKLLQEGKEVGESISSIQLVEGYQNEMGI